MKNKVNSFYKGAMFIYMALCGILSLYGSSYNGYYDYVSGSGSSAENLIEVQLDWYHQSGKYYYCEYETGLVPILDNDGWVELHFGNGNSSYSTWEVVAAPEWIEWRQGYGTKGEGASGLTFFRPEDNSGYYGRVGTVKIRFGNKTIVPVKEYSFRVSQMGDAHPTVAVTNPVTWRGGIESFQVIADYDIFWEGMETPVWVDCITKNGRGTGTGKMVIEPNLLEHSRTGYFKLREKYSKIKQQGQFEFHGPGKITVRYGLYDEGIEEFFVDDEKVFSSEGEGEFIWQPQRIGSHKLVYTAGGKAWTNTLYVKELDFATQMEPNPPMAKDDNISIYPLTDHFDVSGGGLVISTSGSGTWTAVASEPWITLNSTSGTAGKPLAFRVSANTNVEERTAYIYVSGHVYTATQAGLGATVNKSNETFEHNGGFGTVNVTAQNRIVWQARPNVDWISVSPTSGSGEGSVEYQVAPFNEVSTRQGTMTVAGNTVTVFQYGRRMKLATYEEKRDWYTHVIPITVDALAITEWSVTPNASWISVVDAGNGKGGDLVSIAISENPSYKERVGTVTIGTETFTVTQDGRTDLEISIDPVESEASVNGANALLSVYATPDLPWTVTSDSSWVTIYDKFKNGAGNGNVVYTVTPNSTLYDRTAIVSVTPEKASGMPTRKHTVRQPAAESAISLNGYEFEAAGESCSVEVSVADIVEWKIEENLDWITINGSTSRMGSGTVVIQAAANDTVYPRSGTITIARKTFTVTQKARGVEVEYEEMLFSARGGSSSVSIHPDGNVAWTVEVSDDWIIVWGDESGTGDAEIEYMVAAWNDEGSSRTGWIKIGDKAIYITQRAYDLSISPNGKKVTGNNGAGEIGVSASIGDVWNAIVTEPWITIVDGYDSGTGSGTVRFIYTENNTGKTRTGTIIVVGEVYTLEQAARTMVAITATAGRGGKVSGGGSYDLGSEVTITAIPDDGYKFSYWTGDVESMQNPIKVTADVAKSVSAVFEPLPIAFESVESSTDGVRLSWNNLAWATAYRIYRGVTSVPSSATQLAEIVNTGNCTYLDESGVVGTTYWYWIEAEGAEDSVMSDPMTGVKQKPIVISPITYQNLRGATHTNPESYQEGTLVSFTNPSGVTGYTFAGWTPSQITADMTGAQTVRASWTANSYTISYNANGGSGTMDGTSADYDSEATVAENGFTWSGHEFKGWATEPGGAVVYAPGQPVTNLTAQSGGIVTLYAVWEEEKIENPVITPSDGSIFKTDVCTVTITCATPDAKIYYTTNGRTPSVNDRYLYQGPFMISETTTVTALAVRNGKMSDYVDATITYVEPEPLTLKGVLDEPSIVSVETGGVAEWMPIYDENAKVSDSLAISGAIEEGDEKNHQSWIMVKVNGKGTLSFWWRVDCEPDPGKRFTWDRGVLTIDGNEVDKKDGITGWVNHSVTFDTAGEHEIILAYISDGYLPVEEDVYAGCMWVDGFVWTPKEEFPALDASATKEMISQVLSGAADAKLSANIKTAAEYSAFRSWVKGLPGTSQDQVKSSPNAWLSYVLDAGSLIEGAVLDERVKVEELAVGGESGIFDMKLRIADVSIGAGATVANLLRVFAVEGTASLADEDFSVEKVAVSFGEPDNGAISLAVTPRQTGNAFFVRTRLRDQLNGDKMNGCEVSFNLNGGGSLPEGMSAKKFVEYASAYGELPMPTREGYVFDGWYTAASGGEKVTSTTEMTIFAVQTLYARWIIKSYAIVFDANGGSGGVTKSYTHGAALGELPTPTRDGYKFLGWFTASEGGNAVTSETIVIADMTIYARWESFDGHDKVQLWEGGPYWATTNIGAEKPEDYGYYFWWGDTVGYKRENNKWVASDGSNSNFSFEKSNIPTYGKDNSSLQSEGWITADGALAPEHDAAHKHWGGNWRMPTMQEFDDLDSKCDWTWGSLNGVNGYIVRGRGDYASRSIFLPCTGYGNLTSLYSASSGGRYWSSVPYSGNNNNYDAWYLYFNSSRHNTSYDYRFYGRSVRPLQGSTK